MRSGSGIGARLAAWVFGLAALAALLPVLDRLFLPYPLYGGDEGAYLIHARFAGDIARDPRLVAELQGLGNSAFLAIIRALTYVTHNLLPWLRILGLAAYVGGIALTWRAMRPHLKPEDGAGLILLLALAFPYHRFVAAALPEGWYVAALGALILLTARTYLTRPWLHAALAGVLAAVLVLLKPHGVAVVAALVVLALLDGVVGRRGLILTAGRITVLLAVFLVAGNLIQLACGAEVGSPLAFFMGGHYERALEQKTGTQELMIGLKALVAHGAGALLLAGVPLAAGVAGLSARLRDRAWRPDAPAITFALVTLAFGATIAMIAIFAMKALTYGPTEVGRVWGRYFEFFVPLMWIAAAPYLGELDRRGGSAWRIWAAGLTAAGVGLYAACMLLGFMMFPWDATALSAFFKTDMVRWPLDPDLPLFALAVVGCLAAAAAMLAGVRPAMAWLGGVAALALLSSWLDARWAGDILPQREARENALAGARAILATRAGPVLAVTDNIDTHHAIVLALGARAQMLLVEPGADVPENKLAGYRTIVVAGPHEVEGGRWLPIVQGSEITLLKPAP